MLVIGCRLNEPTSSEDVIPAVGTRWIHVDIEPGDRADRTAPERTIVADARAFLRAANDRLVGKAVLDAERVAVRQAGNAEDHAAWEAATVVDALGPDARFDCVFDATGSAASMMKAFDAVASGGRLVFVGLTLEPITFNDVELHRRELTVLASRNATPADFERVIAAVRGGYVDPLSWITHRLSLDELPEAFEHVRREPGLIKAVVTL